MDKVGKMRGDITVMDALAEFRCRNGIDPTFSVNPTWRCQIGPVTLRLPNFRWRRDAILRHDLHHVLTGYPCSMRGEFQMATWEFAAGRYPHVAATAFCLPLVAFGAVWDIKEIWRAFLAGRASRSLYDSQISPADLAAPIQALIEARLSSDRGNSKMRNALAFFALLSCASATVVLPALAVYLLAVAAFPI